MVHWTAAEKGVISSVWKQVDVEADGQETLSRVLITYPWTLRYFPTFGDLSTPAAICSNPKVKAHGKKVLSALGAAVSDPDHIKQTLAHLSEVHAEKLHVDPQNFILLANCLVIVLARKLKTAFSPEVHATWEKFLAVSCAALSRHYH